MEILNTICELIESTCHSDFGRNGQSIVHVLHFNKQLQFFCHAEHYCSYNPKVPNPVVIITNLLDHIVRLSVSQLPRSTLSKNHTSQTFKNYEATQHYVGTERFEACRLSKHIWFCSPSLWILYEPRFLRQGNASSSSCFWGWRRGIILAKLFYQSNLWRSHDFLTFLHCPANGGVMK